MCELKYQSSNVIFMSHAIKNFEIAIKLNLLTRNKIILGNKFQPMLFHVKFSIMSNTNN